MPQMQSQKPFRLAILGAGGLGKGMLERAGFCSDVRVVAMVDSSAYVYDEDGLSKESIQPLRRLADFRDSIPSPNPIMDLFKTHAVDIDGVFVALPNLPVDFIPTVVKDIARAGFKGVMVDALKRTKAVELMLEMDDTLRQHQILYITGAGATPGFLSTVAAVVAQSFVDVKHIDIHFGVGISNWDAYKATIREDFLHMPGFTADTVANMSDADIEKELNKRNGLLELVNMEHADDVILERAGICERTRVTVGGLVDTRNPKKPVSTTVTITGTTARGEEGSHVLTLADETTMVDNVCGPAIGFLRRGVCFFNKAMYGVITSADIMPLGPVAVEQRTLSIH